MAQDIAENREQHQ